MDVQLFIVVAREPFILFCGYLDIGDRDYKGFYIWDDDFFHCATAEMSNVFSRSDLAILSHIQKTAQGKSCACFIDKRVVWEGFKATDTELYVPACTLCLV